MLYRFPRPRHAPFRSRVSVAALLALAALLTHADAFARGGGFVADECGGCHRGATVPRIIVSPASMVVSPGQTTRVTVTFETTSRNIGFFFSASSGRLVPVPGESTKAASEGITHSSPITASGGRVVIHGDWTAPANPGGVDFRAAAVAGNGDGRSGGDGAASSFMSMAFGCSTGTIYYRDFDGDGYGYDESAYTRSCGKPEGYGEKFGDCDDNEAKIFPGATEVCNRRDDDCDGTTDEGLEGVLLYPDKDGDGWGRRGNVDEVRMGCGMERGWGIEGTDCDDNDTKIFPGAVEVCNLKDDNCNGRVDEGARADCGVGWCRRLAPGCDGATCTPGKPQKERCNLLDDDCDGEVDEDPESLCEEGLTCHAGRCIPSDEAPPPTGGSSGGTGSGGGASGGDDDTSGANGGTESSGSGCSMTRHGRNATFWLMLCAGAALLAWRRRRG